MTALGSAVTGHDVDRTIAHLVRRRAPSTGTSRSRTQLLCHRLGLDPRTLPTIHVTGTNGKTSTARMVDELLRAAGLSTMRFTSPHLTSVGERLAVDGRALPDDVVAARWERISSTVAALEAVGTRLAFFDLVTTLFFDLALELAPDVAVVEVGRGGRDDATNVAAADVAVFTPIGGDHRDLGRDRVALARAKLGIVTHGGRMPRPPRMVSARQRRDVTAVMAATGLARGAALTVVGEATRLVSTTPHGSGQRLVVATGGRHHHVDLPLRGPHQADNAVLAVATVEAFLQRPLHRSSLEAGLAATTSPGRLEDRRFGVTTVWLDGAHNPTAAAALATALEPRPGPTPPGRRRILVLGCHGDKDLDAILARLGPVVDEVVATTVATPGMATPRQLAMVAARAGLACRVEPDPVVALATAAGLAGSDGEVVVTGSLHLVGALRGHAVPGRAGSLPDSRGHSSATVTIHAWPSGSATTPT